MADSKLPTLTEGQIERLRASVSALEVAERWACSLSTVYRRVNACWYQLQPIAIEIRTANATTLTETERVLTREHLNLSYSELTETTARLTTARLLRHRCWLVAILERKERAAR